MKESYLYKKLDNEKVQCTTCAQNCVIESAKRGICGVRENIDGKLFALNYSKAIAVNIDPVEKKPLFHFLPGTKSLSVATVGCNLRCSNCQNYELSQGFKNVKKIPGQDLSPKDIVKLAVQNNLPSISYTYTEPTIFLEYALDIMKLAKKQGLKNCWVSNGFMSEQSRKLIMPYLDANNIDIKSFSDEFYKEQCGARLNPVLKTAKQMKKAGIWIEITTLIIPTLSDSEEMFEKIALFIKNELGTETPWHVSQFSGAISWKLQNLPETPVQVLEKAYEIGKKSGLKYVYTGNIPGLASEDTICSKCKTLAIDRTGYAVQRYDKNGKCSKCKTSLNLILK